MYKFTKLTMGEETSSGEEYCFKKVSVRTLMATDIYIEGDVLVIEDGDASTKEYEILLDNKLLTTIERSVK